jgi:hypothetical protein
MRIQVTPSGSHAAFVTASQLTSYDNAGKEMMYVYDAATEGIACVSCNPTGDPPQNSVRASIFGIFMSDDGRAFWSTKDPLVDRDTNEDTDIYEYSGGRPQLISSGIGEKRRPYEVSGADFFGRYFWIKQGLVGVSADGVDVYFATSDTLVPQDHNGNVNKIYDARTSGGFPVAAQVAPCKAADECHGPTEAPPVPPSITSTANLGDGGNVTPRQSKRHRRKHRRRRYRHRRQHNKHQKQRGKRHIGRVGK